LPSTGHLFELDAKSYGLVRRKQVQRIHYCQNKQGLPAHNWQPSKNYMLLGLIYGSR